MAKGKSTASAVQRALLKEVDKLKPDLIRLTQELVRTPSVNPPGDEREVAEIVRAKLVDIGLKTRIVAPSPKRVNVLSVLEGRGNGPTLLFNGHTDVVPVGDTTTWDDDPFSGAVKNELVFGRGASDMKGALASIVVAINAIVRSGVKLNGDVVFHAVADEEAGANYGTKYLVSKGFAKADFGVVAEGSVFNSKICLRPAVRGSCWVKLETLGKAAHASNPAAGVNAVLQMARLLEALRNLKLNHKAHYILPPPTISPGTTIQGGQKVNIIPDRCMAEVDVRTIPGMRDQDVLSQIWQVIESLAKFDKNFRATATIMSSSDPAEIPRNSKIIQIGREATKNAVGYYPPFRAGYGSNDSTYLINKAKVPTLCGFGPGDHDKGNAHGPNEKVSIKVMIEFAKIYALMCIEVCRVSRR